MSHYLTISNNLLNSQESTLEVLIIKKFKFPWYLKTQYVITYRDNNLYFP